jgi:prolyl oligopeptidase
MIRIILLLLILAVIDTSGQRSYTFPVTWRQDITDTIWGRQVRDPYRWLEDIHSDQTKQWLDAQKKLKERNFGLTYYPLIKYLTRFSSLDYKPVFKEGNYFFLYQYEEEGQTPSLYYMKEEDKSPRLLFNPNYLDRKSTISIDGISISDDNRILALMLSKNSGDWKTIRFMDIGTKRLLDDIIRFVKYSPIYWSGAGVFYSKYDVQSTAESFSGLIKGRALYYHKLGTSQEADRLVFKPDNEYQDFAFEVTPNRKFLVIYHTMLIRDSKIYAVSLLPLPADEAYQLHDFIYSKREDVYFNVLGELKDKLLVQSNLNAPYGALFAFDPYQVNQGEVFTPQSTESLEYSKLIGGKILRIYNNGRKSYVIISDLTGKALHKWDIPDGFTFSNVTGSVNDSVALFYFNSFIRPPAIYKVNLNTFEKENLSKTSLWRNHSELITEKIFYSSKDSTLIPMYITHKKDIRLHGNNPTILYGYGGFGISMEPFYNVANMIFLENGGILATPCVRGGGEYMNWHEKGRRLNKQNSFDDFIAAAEYLISHKYTNPGKLAAMGSSHGGLLVGACMVQRPDLFRVVVAESPVLDMLRYHLYNIGYQYEQEFGNINDSLDFENLYRYSPVNNVRPDDDYPATLLVAAENDDRVLPFHSFKFLSELQANGTGRNPYVLYYQEKAGHSGSDIFSEKIKTEAYIYSFIFKHLGIEKKIRYFDE